MSVLFPISPIDVGRESYVGFRCLGYQKVPAQQPQFDEHLRVSIGRRSDEGDTFVERKRCQIRRFTSRQW